MRREVYGDYLTALSRTRNQLRDIAHDLDATPAERVARVGLAIAEARAYELRHQVRLIAPDDVAALSEDMHSALRALRNEVSAGRTAASAAYLEKRALYIQASQDLFDGMRRDLGRDAARGSRSLTRGS